MGSFLSTISPDHFFFSFFKIFTFQILKILFLCSYVGPYGSKISKRCSFYNFYLTRTNLYDKKGSHEGISMFWRFVLPKIETCYGILNFFRNMGAYRARIFKSYFSYSFHPISAKLYEDFDYHGRIQAITYLGN